MFRAGEMNMREIRKIARRKTKAAMIRSKLREARKFVSTDTTVPCSPSADPEWADKYVNASTLLREYHMFMPDSANEAAHAKLCEGLVCMFKQNA
jgi:hypothetical protein